ncbi:MAG: pseudouridine-5'-phosphate glycosidase [Planctomycetota bacterium]
MRVTSRVQPDSEAVALETTLLVHGVPPNVAMRLAQDLSKEIEHSGAKPVIVGVHCGQPIVGMTEDELGELLAAGADGVPKLNTSTLGLHLAPRYRGHGATTVSTTMELAAAAGVRVFSTGGIGGVHRGYAKHLDISADLIALSRFPVAVVTSGVKSLLDVEATRETLETLGIPVIGVGTDRFPAFYLRESGAGVDISLDDPEEIGAFATAELQRTGRAVVIANPIPETDALTAPELDGWTESAHDEAKRAGVSGRDVTPFVLSGLHELSNGATLRANLALARSNARLAGAIASAMPSPTERG